MRTSSARGAPRVPGRAWPLAGLLVAALLGACSDSTGPELLLEELRRQRAKWEAVGLRSYTYETRTSCGECADFARVWATVTVREDVVTAVAFPSDAGVAIPPELSATDVFGTMDDVFDAIEDALLFDAYPVEVELEYDPVLGYPTRFGFRVPDPNVADADFVRFFANLAPVAEVSSQVLAQRPTSGSATWSGPTS